MLKKLSHLAYVWGAALLYAAALGKHRGELLSFWAVITIVMCIWAINYLIIALIMKKTGETFVQAAQRYTFESALASIIPALFIYDGLWGGVFF